MKKLSRFVALFIGFIAFGLISPRPTLGQGKGAVPGVKGSGKGDTAPVDPGEVEPLPSEDPHSSPSPDSSPKENPSPLPGPVQTITPAPGRTPSPGGTPDTSTGSGGSQVGGQTDEKPSTGGKSGGKKSN